MGRAPERGAGLGLPHHELPSAAGTAQYFLLQYLRQLLPFRPPLHFFRHFFSFLLLPPLLE